MSSAVAGLPTRLRALAVFALFALPGAAARAQDASVTPSDAPLFNQSGVFETRFEPAAYASAASIYERPVVISMRTFDSAEHPGGVETIGDVHAIYPVPTRELFDVLSDYDHYAGVSARTVLSKDYSGNGDPLGYHRQLQYLSAKVMGIGETFHYVTNNYGVRLPNGAYGIKWNLEQSLDGKFFELYGSWYLAPIRVGSVESTYVRYYIHNGLTAHPPIPYGLLSYITANDVQSLIRSFVQETRRRFS